MLDVTRSYEHWLRGSISPGTFIVVEHKIYEYNKEVIGEVLMRFCRPHSGENATLRKNILGYLKFSLQHTTFSKKDASWQAKEKERKGRARVDTMSQCYLQLCRKERFRVKLNLRSPRDLGNHPSNSSMVEENVNENRRTN